MNRRILTVLQLKVSVDDTLQRVGKLQKLWYRAIARSLYAKSCVYSAKCSVIKSSSFCSFSILLFMRSDTPWYDYFALGKAYIDLESVLRIRIGPRLFFRRTGGACLKFKGQNTCSLRELNPTSSRYAARHLHYCNQSCQVAPLDRDYQANYICGWHTKDRIGIRQKG